MKVSSKRHSGGLLCIINVLLCCFVSAVHADGSSIDKVYHPYVQQLETELEYRVLFENESDSASDNNQYHRLGLGRSLSDTVFIEGYVVGNNSASDDFEISAVEAELKLQLSEQGEFDNDWGLLFELEAERDERVREFSTTLIALHEWSRWIGTANMTLAYEWGSDIDDEFESSFSGQLRYRYSAAFEPAVELYIGQNTQGLGPVFTGVQRLGGRKKLNWEAGVVIGLDSDTPNSTWKLGVEYEF